MPDKAILPYLYKRADEAMGLNPRAAADFHIALNLAKWSDKDIIAQGAAIEIAWLDNRGVFTMRDIVYFGV